MSALAKSFGRRIKRARDARGWSLREFAEKCGVTASTVSRAERGTSEVWLVNAAAFASALELSLDTLTAPESCSTCDGIPPAGFTCNECGTAVAP